jgi:hypothetical protein
MSEWTDTYRTALGVRLLALGARLSLRVTARQVLDLLDRMTGHEMLMAGWRSGDISALADLAQMRVDGVPFGEWSDEGARQAIARLDMQP